MKTIRSLLLLLALLLPASWARGEEPAKTLPEQIRKETYLYSVKDSSALYLDLYRLKEEAPEPRPVVMFVFGGSFARGKRDHDSYIDYFRHLAEQGFVVASIDYRLGMKDQKYNLRAVSRGPLREAIQMAVEDLFSATRFLVDRADQLHLNPDSILASGSSAGAITVVQADWAIKNRMAGSGLLPSGFTYKGIISFAGAIYSTVGGPKYLYGLPAPTLFIHGNKDWTVPHKTIRVFNIGMFSSRNLARRFRRIDAEYAFIEFEGKDHAFGAVTAMTEGMPFVDWFIGRYIRSDRGGEVKITVDKGF